MGNDPSWYLEDGQVGGPVLRSSYSILNMFNVICRRAQARRPCSGSFRIYSIPVSFQVVPSGRGRAHVHVHVLKIFRRTQVGMQCTASKLQLLRDYIHGVLCGNLSDT